MTRIGINPARGKTTANRPARVTVTVLSYIPSLEGYFQDKLDVLKLSLSSIVAHTALPYDLMVFDNGSCLKVIDYLTSLKQDGLVDYLLLSRQNIGKIDALKILFSAAPGEVLAYSDDDIFFYPGWLEAQLDILDCFPEAGMVSGVPVRDSMGHAVTSLEKLAKNPPTGLTVLHERRIPDEWEVDWALSTGRDPAVHLEDTNQQLDLIFKIYDTKGCAREAIAGANHFQFVTFKNFIQQALPQNWSGKLMGAMRELDEAVDNLGGLRLATPRRYTRHIGNRLSAEILKDVQQLNLLPAAINKSHQSPLAGIRRHNRHWLLKVPGSRKLIHNLYRRLFDILFNS